MVQIDYSYLRPKKAQWLKRMYASTLTCRENLSVWEGKNATILPLRDLQEEGILCGRGGVVDEQGQFVELSGFPERTGNAYPFENPVYKDERVVYCGYLMNHWGHFLVECVNRLWYALETDASVDKFVFFVDENEERTIKGNYKEFFELLHIWDKMELVNTPTTYREVIVPEISAACMKFYSPQYLAIFDAAAANAKIDPSWETYDKIYFTRSSFAKGNDYDFGLDSLDSFFRNNDFYLLAPETVTLSHMIYLIRGASEIATISGSVHHNMLFGQNGKKLTIMERLIINDDHQVTINRLKELNVTPVDANFHLYPVDTCGPYIVGCNHILEQFMQDKHMTAPDENFADKAYRDTCFKQYMRSYQDNYRHRWFMASWYAEICDSLYEAYEDNYSYFREFLDGEQPFLKEQRFQWHYIKQFIKRIIRPAK